MGKLVSLDLTVEDLGAAMWALAIAPRFGLTFRWSGSYVTVRGWSVLTPPERAPFEMCRPAIRALLTPDASGRAGLDYISALGPPPERAILKPSTADKIAAAAADHRGDPATRAIAWRKLYEGGVLRPMEPRLPPPEPLKPDYSKPGWRSSQAAKNPKPTKSPPAGCGDWSEAWIHFRHKANWTGDKNHRTATMWGFRVVIHGSERGYDWSVKAPNGMTMSGAGLPHESAALGQAWQWVRLMWP
jgi:hypothetical protein